MSTNCLKHDTPILGIIMHPTIKKRLILYSNYYFLTIDLSRPYKPLKKTVNNNLNK